MNMGVMRLLSLALDWEWSHHYNAQSIEIFIDSMVDFFIKVTVCNNASTLVFILGLLSTLETSITLIVVRVCIFIWDRD